MQPLGPQLFKHSGYFFKKAPKGSALSKELSPVVEAKIRDAIRQHFTGFKPLPIGVRPGDILEKK